MSQERNIFHWTKENRSRSFFSPSLMSSGNYLKSKLRLVVAQKEMKSVSRMKVVIANAYKTNLDSNVFKNPNLETIPNNLNFEPTSYLRCTNYPNVQETDMRTFNNYEILEKLNYLDNSSWTYRKFAK